MPGITEEMVSPLYIICFYVYYCYQWLQIQKPADVNDLKAQWLLWQGPVNWLGKPPNTAHSLIWQGVAGAKLTPE